MALSLGEPDVARPTACRRQVSRALMIKRRGVEGLPATSPFMKYYSGNITREILLRKYHSGLYQANHVGTAKLITSRDQYYNAFQRCMLMDPTFDSPADQFQYLYQIWELGNNHPEKPVSIRDLAVAMGIKEGLSAAMAGTLREFQLVYYRTLGGDIALTRLGLSEVITARKHPSIQTNFFPSLRSMNLRFSRGHHPFESEVLRKSLPAIDGTPDETLGAALDHSGIRSRELLPAPLTESEDSPAQLMRDLEELLEELQQEISNVTGKNIEQEPDDKAKPRSPLLPDEDLIEPCLEAPEQHYPASQPRERRWGYLGRERSSGRKSDRLRLANERASQLANRPVEQHAGQAIDVAKIDATKNNASKHQKKSAKARTPEIQGPSLLFNNRWHSARSRTSNGRIEKSKVLNRVASEESLTRLQHRFGLKPKPIANKERSTSQQQLTRSLTALLKSPVFSPRKLATDNTTDALSEPLPEQMRRLEELLDQKMVGADVAREAAHQEISDGLEEVNLLLFSFDETATPRPSA